MDSSNPRDTRTSPFRNSLQNLVLSRAVQILVFIQNEDGTMTIVAVYVDDLVVMSSSFERLSAIKKALSGGFKMKDVEPLTGYSDFDWAGDCDDGHFNLFIFGGAVICWTRKQPVVALSTAKSEYIALSSTAQEAAWLQKLLADLQCHLSQSS